MGQVAPVQNLAFCFGTTMTTRRIEPVGHVILENRLRDKPDTTCALSVHQSRQLWIISQLAIAWRLQKADIPAFKETLYKLE